MANLSRRAVVALLALLAVPLPARAQEVVEYYGLDALGSVRVIFNAQGGVVDRMDYGPFGENLRAAIKFPAEQFAQLARDGETGQDYAQARNYSPGTGRFNRVDPVYAGLFEPQKWNRYSYAANRPVSHIDPTGLDDVCATATTTFCEQVTAKAPPIPARPPTYGESWWLDFLDNAIKLVDLLVGSAVLEAPDADGNTTTGYVPPSITLEFFALGAAVVTGQAKSATGILLKKSTDDVVKAVAKAGAKVGPGRGSVYGTRYHTALKNEIKALDKPGLRSEVSFLNGKQVEYGTPGSVRLDVVQFGPNPNEIVGIYDLKTGSAILTDARAAQIQSHLPLGQTPPIIVVRPCAGGC